MKPAATSSLGDTFVGNKGTEDGMAADNYGERMLRVALQQLVAQLSACVALFVEFYTVKLTFVMIVMLITLSSPYDTTIE